MEKISETMLYCFDRIDMLIKINSVIFKTVETGDKSVLLQINQDILAVIEASQRQLI